MLSAASKLKLASPGNELSAMPRVGVGIMEVCCSGQSTEMAAVALYQEMNKPLLHAT